jgi:hypothetical protein
MSQPSRLTRFTRASTPIASKPAATAGAGPRTAIIVVCTIRPADTRTFRVTTETVSASTMSTVSATTRLTGCQSSASDVSAVIPITHAKRTTRRGTRAGLPSRHPTRATRRQAGATSAKRLSPRPESAWTRWLGPWTEISPSCIAWPSEIRPMCHFASHSESVSTTRSSS